MNKLAMVISVVAAAISTILLSLLWKVPSEIKHIGTQVERFQQTQKKEQKFLSIDDPLQGFELKRIGDVDKRRAATGTNIGIEELAKITAEVDEWFFAPEDEGKAIQIIEAMTQELRDMINNEATALAKAALEAPNGKTAAEIISKINSLLIFYPSPMTTIQRDKLNQLTARILTTSKRVEEIQRLRYNQQAVREIENGLVQYRKVTKVSGVGDLKKIFVTDKDELTRNCIDSLSKIDPALLEPATLDLYNYAYGLTRDALGDDDARRIALARGFADPKTVKLGLRHF